MCNEYPDVFVICYFKKYSYLSYIINFNHLWVENMQTTLQIEKN